MGEVRIFPWGVLPRGWLRCDGSLLPVTQNQALFSLLGINYGGDGKTTFGLPDLRGRVIVNQGLAGATAYQIGSKGGAANVTLALAQVPAHAHSLRVAEAAATVQSPTGNLLTTIASSQPAANVDVFASAGSPQTTLAAASIGTAAGGAPHENMQPFLALNFCICNSGIYPTRQ